MQPTKQIKSKHFASTNRKYRLDVSRACVLISSWFSCQICWFATDFLVWSMMLLFALYREDLEHCIFPDVGDTTQIQCLNMANYSSFISILCYGHSTESHIYNIMLQIVYDHMPLLDNNTTDNNHDDDDNIMMILLLLLLLLLLIIIHIKLYHYTSRGSVYYFIHYLFQCCPAYQSFRQRW